MGRSRPASRLKLRLVIAIFVILLHKNMQIPVGAIGWAGRLAEAREPAGASYSKSGRKAWSVAPF